MFDGPQSRHGQLLLRLAQSRERRVIRLDHNHAPTARHGVVHDLVVGDLKADDVAEQHRPGLQDPRLITGRHVTRHAVQSADKWCDEGAERDVLPEGHGVRLHVDIGWSGLRVPHDADVGDTRGIPRSVDDRAHEDRCVDGARGGREFIGDCPIRVRIDVHGVLRPDDDIRLGHLPRGNVLCQPQRLRKMALENLAAFVSHRQARAGHSPLDDRGHGRFRRPLALDGAWHEKADKPDGDQADRRRRDPPAPGQRARHGDENEEGQQRARECRGERDRRGSRYSRPRREGRCCLRESKSAPGEAAKRNAVAQGFLQYPHARHPQGPPAQSRHQCLARSDDGDPKGAQRDEKHPGVTADHGHPPQQNREGHRPLDGTEESAPPPCRAKGRDHEGGNGRECEQRGAHRREGQGQHDAGADCQQNPPGEPQRRQACQGRAHDRSPLSKRTVPARTVRQHRGGSACMSGSGGVPDRGSVLHAATRPSGAWTTRGPGSHTA